jgi:hypothetical protein
MNQEESMNANKMRDNVAPERHVATPTRRSHWVVGVALLVSVALVLGGAVLLNQRLRPAVGTLPAPIAHAQEKSRYTFVLGRQVLQQLPTDAEPVVAPSPQASPDPIDVDLALLEEVESAYSTYWDVRTEAALNLDVSRLPEVMAGTAIERERQQIADLESRGVAAKIEADHDVGLQSISQDEAELYDEYVNRSYLIDPVTRQPVGAPEPDEVFKVSFRLQRLDGVWKVVDSERHV